MPSYEIYELQKLKEPSTQSQLESGKVIVRKNTYDLEKLHDCIQRRTLQSHFLRMSSTRKIDLITKMFVKVKNLHSLSVILNNFFAVNTKLIHYSKVSLDSNALYEQYIADHDRMLDTTVLNETIEDDLLWYENLENYQQQNIITDLLRLSGGNIIKKMYWRLMKIFNAKAANINLDLKAYRSDTRLNFPEDADDRLIYIKQQTAKPEQEDHGEYNTDCPTHKKVVEGRKQWQATMAKLRKEIDTELQKLNEPALQRIRDKERSQSFAKGQKLLEKTRSTLDKASSSKLSTEELDWVQLLPVWCVKQIFSYLDEKTLLGLKHVNNYWAAISKEVLGEFKARESLNATIKKSQEFLDVLLDMPIARTDLEVKPTPITETTGRKRRLLKLRRTGAFTKQLREPGEDLHNKCVIAECLAKLDIPFLAQLKPFPTSIPIKQDDEKDKSSLGSTNDSEISLMKPKIAESRVEFPDQEDRLSIASVASLVPSIIVTEEDKDTW